MKYKIGFRLDIFEMIIVLFSTFFAGMLLASDLKDKYIYFGLAILGAGGMLIKKRVKMPLKDKNVEQSFYSFMLSESELKNQTVFGIQQVAELFTQSELKRITEYNPERKHSKAEKQKPELSQINTKPE